MIYAKAKKLSETAVIPKRATIGSAGMDLVADNDQSVVIRPGETVMLQTNIAMAIPEGYFGAIFARSGLSVKLGIRPATCVSVIDSDYRGSIGVPLYNDSSEPAVIGPHERVAQLILMECPKVLISEVEELDDTMRGSCGYGSTGRV